MPEWGGRRPPGDDAALVTVRLGEDGRPSAAWLHMGEFAGLADLARGQPFTEMPALVSRLYGICPVSHLLAATEACERVSNTVVPDVALQLRQAAGLGEIVQSHALGVLHLASPRALFGLEGPDDDPGGISGAAEVVREGVVLRRFGQLVVDEIAGRRRRYDSIVIGGLARPLGREARDAIVASAVEALEAARRSLRWYREKVAPLAELASTAAPSLYLGLVSSDGSAAFGTGGLRVVDGGGRVVGDGIDPARYYDHLGRDEPPESPEHSTYWKDLGPSAGRYRVGPLARLNVAEHLATAEADAHLALYRQDIGRYPANSFQYHYARLVELVHCVEAIGLILQREDALDDRVSAERRAMTVEGVGVREAPRGTLWHHYRVDDAGLVLWAGIVSATAQNSSVVNQGVLEVARSRLSASSPKSCLFAELEAVIRCYDPCLPASSHAVGEMPIAVRVIGPDGAMAELTR